MCSLQWFHYTHNRLNKGGRTPERGAFYRLESALYLYAFVLLSLGIVTGAVVLRAIGGGR
mgnify:CR=1 FL=1